jgi:hypothetical protein
MHMLQLQNIKRDVTKKISIDTLTTAITNNNDVEINANINNEIHISNNPASTSGTTGIDDIDMQQSTDSISYPKPNIENENLGTEINFK